MSWSQSQSGSQSESWSQSGSQKRERETSCSVSQSRRLAVTSAGYCTISGMVIEVVLVGTSSPQAIRPATVTPLTVFVS